MKGVNIILVYLLFFMGLADFSFGQTQLGQETNDRLNTITTAVPFLIIAPDSRAGAMGEAGVATTPDVSSIHWNPSKLAFVEDEFGAAVSYSPWLRGLNINDIFLGYVSGYKKIDKMQAVGASMRYFSLGNITFTNEYGEFIQDYEPQELAFDVAYSRLLTDNLSGGIALRYINSNLTGGQTTAGADTKPGRAVAVDVSAYYVNENIKILEKDAEFALGMNISNIGNKMSYSSTSNRDFIPINMRIGPRMTYKIDDFNAISFTFDVNKLLVPSPPLYAEDGSGELLAGKDPNRAVASGIFGSFTDAPGKLTKDDQGNYIVQDDGSYEVANWSRFREEIREFNIATGIEYWYGTQFALRAGYFWEHELKGNRKFTTLGLGFKYNVFGMDLSYLIPTYFKANVTQNNPLKNTLRFTLSLNFDAFEQQQEGAQ